MMQSDFWLDRAARRRRDRANRYFSRHGLDLIKGDEAGLASPGPDDLGMIVVIPALAEPELAATLASLQRCDLPDCIVEILVLINHAESADEKQRWVNRQTLQAGRSRGPQRIQEHFVLCEDLPDRHAGVGLARKLGLDAALTRLLVSRSGEGVLLCLDADCLVESNYLCAVWEHFEADPECQGASVYFEHSLEDAANREAIAGYELHLRYFVQGLRYAGMPHVFHTVGSCMAVRSDAYMDRGGMNRRQAGEDYYFVQKLAETGAFSDLTSTVVQPSARRSWRVPFGTGRAMAAQDEGEWRTYAPEVFDDLAVWLARIPAYHDQDRGGLDKTLPASVQAFLAGAGWPDRLAEIRAHTASRAAFQRRVLRWFNNFAAMKLIHQATAERYPKVAVGQAAGQLLQRLGVEMPADTGPTPVETLLTVYRGLCRDGLLEETVGRR
ncbi:MAG: glycosyltransferase [Pseudomonadota bacterium]